MAFVAVLRLEGIEGESSPPLPPGAIEVLSWSWGATNSGSSMSGAGGGAGKVVFQDIHFTKRCDKSSPQLLLRCATGQHIPSATLSVHRVVSSSAGTPGLSAPLFSCDLTRAVVSSFQASDSSSSDDAPPTEECALSFSQIRFSAGGASVCWDVQQRRAC